MAISPSLIPLLQCPVSGQHLHLASPAECSQILAVFDPVATGPGHAAETFLVTSDGRYAYAIRDGIPVLVADECIRLGR